jgi:hypothetical protein
MKRAKALTSPQQRHGEGTFTLHDNPDAGISLDLAFDHNCIANAVLTANGLGIFMRASRDNRFQNIFIRHSHQFGVFIAQTEVATPLGRRPLAHS